MVKIWKNRIMVRSKEKIPTWGKFVEETLLLPTHWSGQVVKWTEEKDKEGFDNFFIER